MARNRSRRDDNQRRHVAYLAARLMAEEGIADYAFAKQKAARQAGLADSQGLPDNREIEAAHVKLAALQLLWRKFFLTFDYLIMAATPFPALRKDACTLENRQRLLDLTSPASLGGLPVLTVPVHLGSSLTSGLQIVVSTPISPAISMMLSRERSVAFSA